MKTIRLAGREKGIAHVGWYERHKGGVKGTRLEIIHTVQIKRLLLTVRHLCFICRSSFVIFVSLLAHEIVIKKNDSFEKGGKSASRQS